MDKFQALAEALELWGIDYEWSRSYAPTQSEDIVFLCPNELGLNLAVYFSSKDGIGAYNAE